MTSQGQDELHRGFGLRFAGREKGRRHPGSRHDDSDNLGYAASNRTITITLVLGISLMVLILMLPYLSGL
ncbi:hypothetical protein [Nesterenkonia sphaerica]|uniref:Uncharacterized protein n=1 Tax=Nesterenkonia sphaerica TaxID=1804988 RepID=A0A5R9AMR3_9MICC|nr:hypothetical protein [Nesterenkonia sphaerica]TLP79927.1 hypothetical protein FEF27_00645 [Nesterenkonia sphaerica]